MGDPHRRRYALALEGAAPHHAPASPPPLSPADWYEISETLDGILRVEFPSPFTDLALQGPKEAWLVLDLARARASVAAIPRPSLTIERVLDAFTRLLVRAETSRPWRDSYEAFWRRVLTSDMCSNREELAQDPWLWRGFVKFTRARGTHVAFQWRGRRLEPSHVIQPLCKCLGTIIHISRSHSHVPVRVSLRFEECELTSKTLTAIYSLLSSAESPCPADKTLLFEANTLRELSLSGNILHAHALRDLAHVLRHPATRRVDGLTLNSTVPGESHQTPAYTASFRSLLSTILTAKDVSPHEPDRGLSLSLEDCTIFRAAYVEALTTALTGASRPLRSLSLACWHLPEATALDRFAHLLWTELPTATSDFDLDVSCIRGTGASDAVEAALQDARATLIEAALPRARAALAAGGRVSIRLACLGGYVMQDEELTTSVEWEMSHAHYYNVSQITPDNRIEIGPARRADDDGEDDDDDDDGDDDDDEPRGWTNWWTVVNMRMEDSYVLRCAPSGLIADHCRRRALDHGDCGRVVLELASVTGAELTRLSMRHNWWGSQQYVSWCPRLQEFSAQGDREFAYDDQSFWGDDDIPVDGRSLQVIHAAHCNADTTTLRKFLRLPNVRSLRLEGNKIDLHGLQTLYDKLHGNYMLEFVDIRRADFDPAKLPYADIRFNVEWLFQIEHMGVDARRAFWSVLRHLESQHNIDGRLSGDVYGYILSFLDTREQRVVVW